MGGGVGGSRLTFGWNGYPPLPTYKILLPHHINNHGLIGEKSCNIEELSLQKYLRLQVHKTLSYKLNRQSSLMGGIKPLKAHKSRLEIIKVAVGLNREQED